MADYAKFLYTDYEKEATVVDFSALPSQVKSKNLAAAKNKETPSERIGDWECLNCANVNYGFRKECNRCNLMRSEVGNTITSNE